MSKSFTANIIKQTEKKNWYFLKWFYCIFLAGYISVPICSRIVLSGNLSLFTKWKPSQLSELLLSVLQLSFARFPFFTFLILTHHKSDSLLCRHKKS